MGFWIMYCFIHVKPSILFSKRQLLRVIQKLLNSFICQSVIQVTLLDIKRIGQHRHKYLLIDCNRLQRDLASFFYRLAVVLNVKKCDHLFVVMFIRCQPESKLVTAFFPQDQIVSSVGRYLPPLS